MSSTAVFLPRPRLTGKVLSTIREHGLTVVVAPMGYGKTTLARSVAGAAGVTALYYSVPAGPHDARFLWHDMSGEFEAQGMALAPVMSRLGFPETASQMRQALDQLRALAGPAYLILDDYHHVTDQAMNAFWESVVREEVPGLHIVLFSRTRPEMHLEELAIKRFAAVCDQGLLAFSGAEAVDYFRLHGIHDVAAAAQAQRYSEGWPAALWLCLQSWLQSGRIIPSPDIESLLANTVFSSYTPEERNLLMRLSVPENFTEEEAAAIATFPGASARLRGLREKNAFLMFDMKTGCYHFHGIFRDFLRKELAASDIGKPALYRLVGECRLERKDIISAIRLFAQAGRDEDRHRILDMFLLPEYDSAFVYFYEEIFTLTESIPWRVRLQNPLGYIAFVALCFVMRHDLRFFPLLEEAEEQFRNAPEIPAFMRKRLQGEVLIIRGLLAFNDMLEVRDLYAEAFRLLGGPSVILSKETAWSYGCPSLSFVCIGRAGVYGELVNAGEEGWNLMVQLFNGTGRAGEKLFRAEFLLERGDLAEADALAREVALATGDDKQIATALCAAFCRARLAIATGAPEKAAGFLEALRPTVERLEVVDHLECLDMALGYINATLGRLEGVPQWLRDGEIFDPPHNSLPQAFGFGLTTHCKSLLLEGDLPRLSAVTDNITSCTAPLECLFAHIHGEALKAIAAWRAHDKAEAAAHLEQALALSRPDGIVLPLAEYGGHILPLLDHCHKAAPEDMHLAAARALAARIARVTGGPGKSRDKNLLTPREREFMRYVAEGKSNITIADELGLARVTIKKALSRAYAKLGADSRVAAAQRFIEIYGHKSNMP